MDNNVDSKARRMGKLGISPGFVIVMTTFIDMTGFGMVIPILPFHPETVEAGAFALGILIGSFSLMQFIFSPLLGRLSDKVGRKPILLLSIFSSALSFILFALADSFPLLLVSRITAGMATEAAVAQAYIADITTEIDRATGMGMVGAANGAGFIVGPAIGGFLSIYGLSTLGFVAAALNGINLLFAFLFLPESNRSIEMFVTSNDGYWHRLVKALTKPRIGAVFVILFLITLAFSAIPVIVPLLGIAFFGFGEVEMSYFFMYIGVVQIVLQGILIGRLTKRWGEENLLILGSLLMMFGAFFMPLTPNIVVFLASITIFSSGFGILGTVLFSFISKRTAADEQGGMLGIAQSVGSIARIPGPLIGGFVAELAGLSVAFSISAALLLVASGVGLKAFQSYRFRGRSGEEVVS
jgi:DHA1 family tetracycline resistance protein-like MFS transporter